MHREIRSHARALSTGAAMALWLWAPGAQGEPGPREPTAAFTPAPAASAASAASGLSLKQAFEAAWARQPEALALPARRDAVRAAQQAAQAWTPEPAALEVKATTDRLNRNPGAREAEVGIAVPIWLPGERGRSQALAEAESRALESRAKAAQLRVAAGVREAWWLWQRALIDADIASAQLGNARRMAADVAKRQQAGDLARADHHQAEGAVAAAAAALAQAEAALAAAGLQLQALTGLGAPDANTLAAAVAVAEPEAPTRPAEPQPRAHAHANANAHAHAHAALAELQDQATLAERTAALAAAQSRANPELSLAVTRDRGAFGEAYQQSLTLGLRIPFGAGPRHHARVASARADSAEAEARLGLERQRLQAERASASARLAAARTQLAAAERRARLAAETRGFFDKSFRLGETDLPTRLRIEAEASVAERQAALARIDVAAAISAQRQALGLLPE